MHGALENGVDDHGWRGGVGRFGGGIGRLGRGEAVLVFADEETFVEAGFVGVFDDEGLGRGAGGEGGNGGGVRLGGRGDDDVGFEVGRGAAQRDCAGEVNGGCLG